MNDIMIKLMKTLKDILFRVNFYFSFKYPTNKIILKMKKVKEELYCRKIF